MSTMSDPAREAKAVTPSDSGNGIPQTRGLYIGSAGDVAVTMQGGNTVTFTGVAAGSILPVRVTRVLSTGTTATSIVALY